MRNETTVSMPEGGFAYLPAAGAPFSNGVVALDGFVLRRIRLRRPMPLDEGLAFSARFLREQGRPLAATAGFELRIPAPLAKAGFREFNSGYVAALQSHGFAAGEANPMARTNMAPRFDPPAAAALFAFTFAVPRATAEGDGGPDFVISGKPENVPAAGLLEKAEFVIGELRRRVADLGGRWSDITGAQIYTVQSLDPVMETLAVNGLAGVGLALFPGEPPVAGYEFEMDVRSVSIEENVPLAEALA